MPLTRLAVRRAPGGVGRVCVVVEGLAALRGRAGLEPGPRAGSGGSGDGDGDDGHQVRIAGAGGAGKLTALAGSTVRTRRPSASALVRRAAAATSSRPPVCAARTSLIDSRRRSSAAYSESGRPRRAAAPLRGASRVPAPGCPAGRRRGRRPACWRTPGSAVADR